MIIRAKLLLLCNIIFFCLSVGAVCAETFTIHAAHDLEVPDDYCVGFILHEWPPNSDHVSHDLGLDSSITLERYETGSYFFSAQWVIYAPDGSYAQWTDGTLAISDESDVVQYDIHPVVVPDPVSAPDQPNPPDIGDSSPDFLAAPAPEPAQVRTKVVAPKTTSGVGIPVGPRGCFVDIIFSDGGR